MFMQYCDKCKAPIKSLETTKLLVIPPESSMPEIEKYEDISEYYKDYNVSLTQIQEKGKCLCPGCLKLFYKFFELRFQNMEDMLKECEHLFGIEKQEGDKDGNK